MQLLIIVKSTPLDKQSIIFNTTVEKKKNTRKVNTILKSEIESLQKLSNANIERSSALVIVRRYQ